MQCPRCSQRTEVVETLQRGSDTRRRRRCLSTRCLMRFSTIESSVESRLKAEGTGDLVASLRLIGAGRKGFDAEAVAAAIRVDRRKKLIEQEQRARERYDDEHAAPRSLNRLTLRRETRGY